MKRDWVSDGSLAGVFGCFCVAIAMQVPSVNKKMEELKDFFLNASSTAPTCIDKAVKKMPQKVLTTTKTQRDKKEIQFPSQAAIQSVRLAPSSDRFVAISFLKGREKA